MDKKQSQKKFLERGGKEGARLTWENLESTDLHAAMLQLRDDRRGEGFLQLGGER